MSACPSSYFSRVRFKIFKTKDLVSLYYTHCNSDFPPFSYSILILSMNAMYTHCNSGIHPTTFLSHTHSKY